MDVLSAQERKANRFDVALRRRPGALAGVVRVAREEGLVDATLPVSSADAIVALMGAGWVAPDVLRRLNIR